MLNFKITTVIFRVVINQILEETEDFIEFSLIIITHCNFHFQFIQKCFALIL